MGYGNKNKDVEKEVKVNVESTGDLTVQSEVKASTPATPARKKQIDRDLMVACRNVTNGTLTYVSRKTGATTDWNSYGDIQYLDVEELLTMRGGQARFLNEPWIVIDDEEVVEYLGLTDMYSKIIPVDDIESFLTGDLNTIKEVLAKAPKGTRELIKDKAREMIMNDTLYDNRIIKYLSAELPADLDSLKD